MKFERWTQLPNRAQNLLICLLLVTATSLAYWQVAAFDFSGYDEFFMVVTNPVVCAGLTPHGVWWALTTSFFEYWHPLTWLSHMLDCQLFGLRPGWHHLVNLLFHLVNTALLFILLRHTTRAIWRSAIVAGLFALHPMHVESIAWVAERKDVLCTLFFLLTIWAYVQYSERTGSPEHRSRTWFRLSLVLFGLGLMCKPMVITLPFVLLLLDYWPLQRFSLAGLTRKSIAPLLREKLPFFLLSFAASAATYVGVRAAGNLVRSDMVPWGLRLANAPIAYARYLGKAFWPTNLVVLYPFPNHWPLWQVIASLSLLLAISILVLVCARSAPYLVVGWFIFLGVLVPTIGLVQVGLQSMADRYTYIPFIGLFIAAVWGGAELSGQSRLLFAFLPALLACLVLMVCGILTRHQTTYWQNGLTLWAHCLDAAPESYISHFNLGVELQKTGKVKQAVEQYRQVLRLKPDHIDSNLNLGIASISFGQMADATNYFAKVLQLKPDYPKAQANMALALRELGDYSAAMVHCAEAIRLAPAAEFGAYLDMARCLSSLDRSAEALYYFDRSLRLDPSLPQTHHYLGLELLKLNRGDEAVSHLEEAVRLAPYWSDAHFQLAGAVAARGETPRAIREYRHALQLQTDSTGTLNNLAWLLATSPDTTLRDGSEAVRLAHQACEQTSWKQTIFVGTLAAAYAEAGDFDNAVATSEKACALASSLGQTNLLQRNLQLLRWFKNRQPWREASSALQSHL